MLQDLVQPNHPDWAQQQLYFALIIFAMLIVQGVMNTYTFSLISWVGCWLAYFMSAFAIGPRHSSRFIFLNSAPSFG